MCAERRESWGPKGGSRRISAHLPVSTAPAFGPFRPPELLPGAFVSTPELILIYNLCLSPLLVTFIGAFSLFLFWNSKILEMVIHLHILLDKETIYLWGILKTTKHDVFLFPFQRLRYHGHYYHCWHHYRHHHHSHCWHPYGPHWHHQHLCNFTIIITITVVNIITTTIIIISSSPSLLLTSLPSPSSSDHHHHQQQQQNLFFKPNIIGRNSLWNKIKGRVSLPLKKQEFQKRHIFLLYWLCQSLWLCGSQ